jgi:CheY-like chemotaxis protein
VSVSDTGTGIPKQIVTEIFEPFFTTKEAGKGTGLGLAISLGIVQQHRGWIDVETQTGVGTTFRIHLPSHPLTVEQPAPASPPRPLSRGDTTIMVVEDEPAVRYLVQRLLTRQGYRVIEAASGDEALGLWAAHRDEVSILLTDIVMPGRLDGHELAARLTAEKPDLRVITMSGYDPAEVADQAGGRPHLRKPFSVDDLLGAIESTLRDGA